jgi:hypothetical protein
MKLNTDQRIPSASAMAAIYAVHYNFARIHETLRITRSMPVGLKRSCVGS